MIPELNTKPSAAPDTHLTEEEAAIARAYQSTLGVC
jgi:hypothetical protein